MANLLRSVSKSFKINYLNVSRVTLVPTRNCGWNRDWKPGPPPKTKEEREAAAKKYYLIPEDYEPYPEDKGYGDYPNLPIVGQDGRDPYEDYDWHYRRRNFGETLHVDYEIYTSERHNPNQTLRYSPLTMITTFLASFGAFILICFIDNYFELRSVYPLKAKQYPKPGAIHYTFEPLD